MKLHVDSIEETRQLAEKLASALTDQTLTICLDGDLGAGKTTFTKALGKALGVKSVINSPTFTILKSYTMADGRPLHHIDAYRLEGIEQDLGFEECFDEGICVVEWSEFIKDQLPEKRLEISIQEGLDENRDFDIEATPEAAKILEVL